ncbi:hypothetical protein V5799_003184 [Amblyomma americanum]|uniref:Uncharacterized protein n=1 Tax=Amblyomma americanum TaxID=6943 RepID=A0AAQ4D9Q8_AMBAM
MSDEEEDSEEVKKETVGFAWSSQACQVRIVVCLFILSVLLGALTAYIIVPRLKDDCKKYHSRKAALLQGQPKPKRGLAIPAENLTDEVNNSSVSALPSDRYAPTRNSHFFYGTISGRPVTPPASVHTQKLPDDIARGMSGRSTTDVRSDGKDDNDEAVVIVENERKIVTASGSTFGGASLLDSTDAVGGNFSVTNGIASRDLSTSVPPVNADRTTAVSSVSEALNTIVPGMSPATKKGTITSSTATAIAISETTSPLSTPVVLSYDASHANENSSRNPPKSGTATVKDLPSKGTALGGTNKSSIVTSSGDAVTGALQSTTNAISEGAFGDTGTDASINRSVEATPSFETTSMSLPGALPSGTNSYRDLVVQAITKGHDNLNDAGAFLATDSGATENEIQHSRRTTQEGGLGDTAASVPQSPWLQSTLLATTTVATLSDDYYSDANFDRLTTPASTEDDWTNEKRVSDDIQDDPRDKMTLETASSAVADEDQEFYLPSAGQLLRRQDRRPPNRAEGTLRN